MAWQKIEKTMGGRNAKPRQWMEVPCVSLGKTSIAFNEKFLDAFGNGNIRGVYILADTDRRIVGFKIATNEQLENDDGWYSVARNSKSSKTKTRQTGTTKRISKLFPDCIGYSYRAHLNPEERIIEVSLSPENRAR